MPLRTLQLQRPESLEGPLPGRSEAVGRRVQMTSCSSSLVLLSFPKLLMQGSHTVNHLGCDHFQWPGMLTVFGSVHGKKISI